MAQRVFVNVIGFSDVERHALNSVFRLSEQDETVYSLWEPAAPELPRLALIDGQSEAAHAQAESRGSAEIPVVWVGESPPAIAIRSFQRPIAWSDVVQTMDELVGPMSETIDFDIDFDNVDTLPPDTQDLPQVQSTQDAQDTVPPEAPPRRRALIVNADLHERLYMRAKLALAELCEADEAENAAQALELARDNHYVLAMIDFNVPDANGWKLLKELAEGPRPIAKVIVTKARPSPGERVHAWFSGATGFFDKPPHPAKLHELLLKV